MLPQEVTPIFQACQKEYSSSSIMSENGLIINQSGLTVSFQKANPTYRDMLLEMTPQEFVAFEKRQRLRPETIIEEENEDHKRISQALILNSLFGTKNSSAMCQYDIFHQTVVTNHVCEWLANSIYEPENVSGTDIDYAALYQRIVSRNKKFPEKIPTDLKYYNTAETQDGSDFGLCTNNDNNDS